MPKVSKVPFAVTNESKEGKHILTLSGTIRKRYWRDEEVIDAKLVRESLEDVEEDVVIKLNSPGGDAFQGIEICNYLKDHPSDITVEVTGIAASAATFIAAGADKVVMNVGTTFMVHEASVFTWGNKAEIKKSLAQLETVDESILNIYVEKTGQISEQIQSWMEEETWFTANEAVENGFADEVKRKTESSETPVDIAAMVNEAVAVAIASFQEPVTNQESEGPKGSKLRSEKQTKSLLNKLRKGE